MIGAATNLLTCHSNLVGWANGDATFFTVFEQLNSQAFGSGNQAAQESGTAGFIEAHGGYIETGYAYIRDHNRDEPS